MPARGGGAVGGQAAGARAALPAQQQVWGLRVEVLMGWGGLQMGPNHAREAVGSKPSISPFPPLLCTTWFALSTVLLGCVCMWPLADSSCTAPSNMRTHKCSLFLSHLDPPCLGPPAVTGSSTAT